MPRRGLEREDLGQPDLINSPEYLSWRRLHLAKSKLDSVTEMSSFIGGFALIAAVELQINDEDIRPPLLAAYVVTTALLVGTCMLTFSLSTWLLPHLQSVAKTAGISGASLSPHDNMRRLIDISWVLTNTASLFLFTLDIILMCWIKFNFLSFEATIAATVILTPLLFIIAAFGILFYRRIVNHQYSISTHQYEDLERKYKQLERIQSQRSTKSCPETFATMTSRSQTNSQVRKSLSQPASPQVRNYRAPRSHLPHRQFLSTAKIYTKPSSCRFDPRVLEQGTKISNKSANKEILHERQCKD